MRVIAKVAINFKFKRLFMRKFQHLKKIFLVSLVTIGFFTACSTSQKQQLASVKAKNIVITDTITQVAAIDEFIRPYREHVDAEMNKVLAQNANNLVKDRNTTLLNTAIGNFMADATYEIITPAYKKRTGEGVDFVILNWGGIRSDLPKGAITMGSAFNLMPFENSAVVITMTGEKVQEMADYLIKHRKPHPLSKQIALQITKDGKITKFTINGKPFDPKATYNVVTSDYLMNGGDEMYFFKDAVKVDTLNYKLRNVLIDYFKQIDILNAEEDHRFEYKP